MNILVTGANGQLGSELRIVSAASPDKYIFTDVNDVPGVETEKLDITDPEAILAMVRSRQIDAIVNCAAYTNVDAAEDNYELAHLLQLTDLAVPKDQENGRYTSLSANVGAAYTSFNRGAGLHAGLAWKTYDPFDDDDAQAFEDLHLVNSGTGVKINPYSDSTNVLMAAFANTPLDWTCASTNVTQNGKDYAGMSASEFNAKYAWNEYSSGGKFAYADLEKIARAFREKIAGSGTSATVGNTSVVMNVPNVTDWEDAWRTLGWNTDSDETLAGVPLSGNTDDLWDIDRKFLESTRDPDLYLFEKMVSGAYLGPLAFMVIDQAVKEGILSQEFADAHAAYTSLSTMDLNAFLKEEESNQLARCCKYCSEEDYDTLMEILGSFISRAAKLAAANLAAADDNNFHNSSKMTGKI